MKVNVENLSPVICIDGKKHNWNHLNGSEGYEEFNYDSWCEKCGSMTEFFRQKNSLKMRRCKDGENYYIKYPKWTGKENAKVKEEETSVLDTEEGFESANI